MLIYVNFNFCREIFDDGDGVGDGCRLGMVGRKLWKFARWATNFGNLHGGPFKITTVQPSRVDRSMAFVFIYPLGLMLFFYWEHMQHYETLL